MSPFCWNLLSQPDKTSSLVLHLATDCCQRQECVGVGCWIGIIQQLTKVFVMIILECNISVALSTEILLGNRLTQSSAEDSVLSRVEFDKIRKEIQARGDVPR